MKTAEKETGGAEKNLTTYKEGRAMKTKLTVTVFSFITMFLIFTSIANALTFTRPAYYNNIYAKYDRATFQKPDFVPLQVRACRGPVGYGYPYMQWDVVVSLKNQGGNQGLDLSAPADPYGAPIDVYVDFYPDTPWGNDNATGEPIMLGDIRDGALLRDMPEQQWMSTPPANSYGGASFREWYPDGGPGSWYVKIPKRFFICLDQFRGNSPSGGTIDESNEFNNCINVEIDRDRYEAAGGRQACFYSN